MHGSPKKIALIAGAAALSACASSPKYYATRLDPLRSPEMRIPGFSVSDLPEYECRALTRTTTTSSTAEPTMRDLRWAVGRLKAIHESVFRGMFLPVPSSSSDRCYERRGPAGPTSTATLARGYISTFAQPLLPLEPGLDKEVELVISSHLYGLEPANRLEKAYTLITPLVGGVEFLESPSATVAQKIDRPFTTKNVVIFPLKNVLMINEDAGRGQADLQGNFSTKVTVRLPTNLCRFVSVLSHGAANGGRAYTSSRICHVERVFGLAASVGIARIVDDRCNAFHQAFNQVFSSGVHCGGADTVDEGDDTVRVTAFKRASIFELWSNPKRLFGLNVRSGDRRLPVMLVQGPRHESAEAADDEGRALFGSVEEALEMAAALRAKAAWRPSPDGSPFAVSEIGGVKVAVRREGNARVDADSIAPCTWGTEQPPPARPHTSQVPFPRNQGLCVNQED